MTDNVKKYEKPEFEVVCTDDPIIASNEVPTITPDEDPSNDGWGPLL